MGLEKNKVNRGVGACLVILILGFAALILMQLSSILLGPSKKACTKKVCLAKFMEGPPAFNDEPLKKFLTEKYFEDSKGPLNLSGGIGFDSSLHDSLKFIKEYFQDKKKGTFVVLGAGDGEYQDLTVPLEGELEWNGLLVEPQPDLYRILKSKGRTAKLSKNCVSPFAYPAMTTFAHKSVKDSDSEMEKILKYRQSKVKQLWDDDTGLTTFEVQCVPLENLLFAGGIEKRIDVLVLDMSGTDLDVLVNVKFDNLPDIEMIIIRSHGNNIGSDIGGYFLDNNIVVKKVFGTDPSHAVYILTKFKSEEDL